jgi:NADPH-dependent 2,4-dienoyl-CoA reductase/sulfur reductase-like enzyme
VSTARSHTADLRSVVVVGASLAGLHAAETLRHEGFDGPISVIGDELHRPYDRPPLSKQVLAGTWGAERTVLPAGADDALDLDWRLGVRATGLDLAAREVALDDGSAVAFDGLVIATGATPRHLPGTGDLAGVHTLRTLDDCLAVRDALDTGLDRVVVVGAGFIGSEVAATCRGRGIDVTLVEALPVPLGRVLGEQMGAVCAEVHREQGVDVRLGVGVEGIDGHGRVEQVRLVDGSRIEAQLVLVGVGVAPNTSWLEGSGLELDNGVVCDATTLAAPGVVAAGDVARWPNHLFDETMRVEHWDNAIEMGAHAARRLLAGDGTTEPYQPVPWFWSDQYDRKVQLAGRSGPDDQLAVVDGSVADRRFVALYGRRGKVVGALGFNMPAKIVRYRLAIADGLSWDDAVAPADN